MTIPDHRKGVARGRPMTAQRTSRTHNKPANHTTQPTHKPLENHMTAQLTQEMYDAAQDEVAYMLQTDEIRADFRKALEALLAVVDQQRQLTPHAQQETRYLLTRDDDGHWYLITEADREAFERYVYEEGNEPASMVRLSGSPSNVTFEAPLEFGKPIAGEGA